ncbi:glycosyltransferase [Knoellia subterranea]|uniref:Glycosyl transferase n=1 Tax=Knoellia subterranea KCTC 19937 TaxID=1385521 RepID=A0A0A0JJ92_9MICO|nr:glycosyltransferase [Knoellia subterranea]KGN37475.1 glycosyl transferase [Knoellia subterranea KCTC 19937]
MKVNILAAGSRGDVQPMVALGVGLVRAGHEVTLCAGDDFEEFVTSRGVGFAPSGARIHELINSPLGVAWLGHSSSNPFRELAALRRFVVASTEGYAGALLPLMGSADVWVSGALTVHAGDALASVGGGQHVVAEFAPMRPTREGSATMQPYVPRRSSIANSVAGQATLNAMASVFALPGDRLRVELGLPPTGRRGFLDAVRRTPGLLAASPVLVPPASDWHGNPVVTGSWYLEDAGPRPASPANPADPELEAWLEGGRTAYVGFGSMPTRDGELMSSLVAQAARAARVRVVLHAGSAGLVSRDDAWVRGVGDVPHGWLFPRTVGVVHHGGAGTTAAALRAGVPQAVVAHIGDQPYWGRRGWEIGVGARPVRRHRLTVEWLTEVLRGFVRGERREWAAEVGSQVQAEDGVGRAVELLERTAASAQTGAAR